MLKTRVITALALLAVLLPVLYFRNVLAFAVVATAFFFAAIWESNRLFRLTKLASWLAPLAAGAVFALAAGRIDAVGAYWFGAAVLLWLLRFVPGLATGLPALGTSSNALLCASYGVAILACFLAMIALFDHSSIYFLSVMALVWVADIGAYFCGKAFGKRKLALTISPGKSWEGAIGGGLCVLVLSSLLIVFGASLADSALADTFAARLQQRFGWAALVAVLLLTVAASVVGDLVESQLKRRAGMKDSSALLPGHGGVLDRIDALIPVLPLAALLSRYL
ncbi:MAG: phosphatidate cytidylyltransferase [Pseudomonadota bacterium]